MSDDKMQVNTDESNNDRREFIRNSVLAAGAVAALGATGSATAQTRLDVSKLPVLTNKKVIDVSFDSHDVVVDDIYQVIKQILDISGCPACGFNGFDLRIGVDPLIKLQTRINAAATIKQMY